MPTVTLTLKVDADRLEVAKALIAGIKGVRIQEPKEHPLVRDIQSSIREAKAAQAGKFELQDADDMMAELKAERENGV